MQQATLPKHLIAPARQLAPGTHQIRYRHPLTTGGS
jgi:hypothetical protein